MLALWGRARPRDFFDVAALIERYGCERLIELAEAKDSGFTSSGAGRSDTYCRAGTISVMSSSIVSHSLASAPAKAASPSEG